MKTYNSQKGNTGEVLGEKYFINQSYSIRHKNYRKSVGEIDLIVEKEETIVFVEVKYRRNLNYGYPKEAVNYSKQKRISKAALWYLKEMDLFDYNVRFDVLEIYFDDEGQQVINHFENAFPLR